MNSQQEQFLNLATRPARVNVEEAAWFLGFSPHEIPVLMSEGMLKPLGHPPRNGPKFFATAELEERRRDMKWLAKASDAIVAFWQDKNARSRSKGSGQNSIRMSRGESTSVEA